MSLLLILWCEILGGESEMGAELVYTMQKIMVKSSSSLGSLTRTYGFFFRGETRCVLGVGFVLALLIMLGAFQGVIPVFLEGHFVN